jgi:hypothetical protein
MINDQWSGFFAGMSTTAAIDFPIATVEYLKGSGSIIPVFVAVGIMILGNGVNVARHIHHRRNVDSF